MGDDGVAAAPEQVRDVALGRAVDRDGEDGDALRRASWTALRVSSSA